MILQAIQQNKWF